MTKQQREKLHYGLSTIIHDMCKEHYWPIDRSTPAMEIATQLLPLIESVLEGNFDLEAHERDLERQSGCGDV